MPETGSQHPAHQAALDSVLPGELRGKVRLVSMATGCWVLYADHGAIAISCAR